MHGTWFFDAQASYHFAFPAAVEGPSLAGWKKWLNETSIAIGCNDVFGQDPPKAYGADFTNSYSYPALIYDGTGRFVYVTLKKNSNAAYQN